MREIKFRGLGVGTNSGWFYGNYWQSKEDAYISNYTIEGLGFGDFIVSKKTVSQFTGLKDKNGKEVYEGHIIACPPIFDGDKPYFIVEWGKNDTTKMVGWMQRNTITGKGVLDDSILEKGQVIGNIYENPELLI